MKLKLNLKFLFLYIAFFLTVNVSLAQDVSFSVSAPRQVYQGDNFYVTYILKNEEGNGLKYGNISGAKFLYGPSVSTSQSWQSINGKTSSSSATEYTLTYRAEKPGTYKVSGATINVKGKAISCSGFTIQILPQSQSRTQSGNQTQSTNIGNIPDEIDNVITAKDVFIKIHLSKSSVYEQEAVVCSIRLYSKYDIASIVSNSVPSFDGFLIEKLPVISAFNNTEKINGTVYRVADLDRYILFPQKSGKLTITSGNYDLTVIQYQKQFSRFGGYSVVPIDSKAKVTSNSASINVIPLPEPKPASFTGAVGNFTISSKLNTNKFKTYEAANYNVTIKGTGNLKYITAPHINFPSQFEVYDPQTTPHVNPANGNMTGSIDCQYTFVPQYIGKFTIPPTQFSFFNPDTKKYETISTNPYTLNIEKGNASQANISQTRKDLLEKNKDILSIKRTNLNLKKDISYYISSPIYWLWYIIPIIAFLIVAYLYRKTIRERADLQFMRIKRAGKVARKKLKLAKTFMLNHEDSKFYNEMLKAIWGYLSDKLSIPVSVLNKENIAVELEKFGASAEIINQIMNLLDECEFAQYAPEKSDTRMEQIYDNTSNIMDELEKIKKNKKQ